MSKKAILKTAAVAAALCGTYAMALRGRTGHPGMEALRGWNYAHRGLHNGLIPENSMAAFRAALEHGYGIELDIHLMKDGNLAVIHDSSLLRTAGVDVRIEDLTTKELGNFFLDGTLEIIPTLDQVLELYAGKAPLIIELKPADNNHKELVTAAVKATEHYQGPYCMESFDPRCVYWLKKDYPHIIRGQLTENFVSGENNLHPAVQFAMTHNLLNFTTEPDFIAYKYQDRNHTVSNLICRRFWGMQGVTWTLRSQAEHYVATEEGWLPIFENYEP